MSGRNVPGPPAPVLVLGDVADRLFPQAADGFQVLEQPDRPRPDRRVIRHGISGDTTIREMTNKKPPTQCPHYMSVVIV
jgi:hypothetical protein